MDPYRAYFGPNAFDPKNPYYPYHDAQSPEFKEEEEYWPPGAPMTDTQLQGPQGHGMPHQAPFYRPPDLEDHYWETNEDTTANDAVAVLIHGTILLVFVMLILNFLALFPALLTVMTDSGNSPGEVWLYFIVPFPPFLVSVEYFLDSWFGINLRLGGGSLVAYFGIIVFSIILSYSYIFRKDAEVFFLETYQGITGSDLEEVDQIPLVGPVLDRFLDTIRARRWRNSQPRERIVATGGLSLPEMDIFQGTKKAEPGQQSPNPLQDTSRVEPPPTLSAETGAAPKASLHRFQGPPNPYVMMGGARPSGEETSKGVTGQGGMPQTQAQIPKTSFFDNDDNKFASDENTFTLVAKFFMVYIFTSLLYLAITIVIFGQTLESPEWLAKMKLWEQAFGLARASVFEEVQARVLLLGLPLYLCHRYFKKDMVKSQGGLAGYLFGGDKELDDWAVLFLVTSSLLFGLAHLSGWDIFKIIPTFIGGLMMGYLFLKKGVPAAILFHFLIDYDSMLPRFFDPGFMLTGYITAVFWVLIPAGGILTLYYGNNILIWLRERYREYRSEKTGEPVRNK